MNRANARIFLKKHKDLVLLVMVLLIAGVLLFLFRGHLAWIATLLSKGSIQEVVSLIRSWGIAAPVISVLLMLFQAVLFPIPSFLVTGANGAVFGLFWGTVISWVGAMLGAGLTFMLARWLGEAFVRRMVRQENLWAKVDQISDRYGFRVILISRLLPVVSFDFISYASGLSRIRLLLFLIATGIGMLPGTIAYVVLGNQITQFNTLSYVMGGMIILGIVITAVVSRIKKSRQSDKTIPEDQGHDHKEEQ
ncbi:MAG: TVP38/TMEM64 family protein [Bacillota bacterium]|nr:TVP38/TMEM64 family protein [Bacillota bacterium]